MRASQRVYEMIGPYGQMCLDRGRYGLGLLPRVNPAAIERPVAVAPGAARATVVISADFELAWAWRYAVSAKSTAELAHDMAVQTRVNFPALLALFDRYSVPVTWATVGHLFLESCRRDTGLVHPEISRLPHFENEFWRFQAGDWFDGDPATDGVQDPDWYAPDLIRSILAAQTRHEIGCHSFSHIAFSDDVCPSQVADDELAQCQSIAGSWNLSLQSMVFPGNLPGNFASLKRHGFTSYRLFSGYELDVPRQDANGLYHIPGGINWEKPRHWTAKAWVAALQQALDRAIATRTVLHLWFHPSCEPVNVEQVFPAVLEAIAVRRHEVWVTTMAGMTERMTQLASTTQVGVLQSGYSLRPDSVRSSHDSI